MDFKNFFGKFRQSGSDDTKDMDRSSIEEETPSDPLTPAAKSRSSATDNKTIRSRSEVPGLETRNNGDRPKAPNKGIVANNTNDSVYMERSEHVERIFAMFGDFGTLISSHILTASFSPGGVKRLTEKLGMTSRGRDGADMAQIETWLNENGSDAFLAKCGLRKDLKAPAPPPPPPTPGKKEVDLRVKAIKGKGDTKEGARFQAIPGSSSSGPRPRYNNNQDTHQRQSQPSQRINLDAVDLSKTQSSKKDFDEED